MRPESFKTSCSRGAWSLSTSALQPPPHRFITHTHQAAVREVQDALPGSATHFSLERGLRLQVIALDSLPPQSIPPLPPPPLRGCLYAISSASLVRGKPSECRHSALELANSDGYRRAAARAREPAAYRAPARTAGTLAAPGSKMQGTKLGACGMCRGSLHLALCPKHLADDTGRLPVLAGASVDAAVLAHVELAVLVPATMNMQA